MKINVKIIPNAKHEEVIKESDSSFKVRVMAPAVDNKANIALIKLMANFLGVKKSSISIIKGEKSRNKTLGVD